MQIIQDVKLDFSDVLFVPKRSTLNSRSEVGLSRVINFKHSKVLFAGVPIIAANMATVGTITMAQTLCDNFNISTALHKHYTLDQLKTAFKGPSQVLQTIDPIFYSMGTSDDEYDRFVEAWNAMPIYFINIDIANGYSEHFSKFIEKIRDFVEDKATIMAGNVVTPNMTEQLILSGADIVKVGIGSGAMCTTRLKTGVGYPQLSAVIECADAAHGIGGTICSDGGCVLPGDVAKAFGAGADFVMLGTMLAGHDECELQVRMDDEGNSYYTHYGMSSKTAMDKFNGGVADYRSSEGRTVKIQPKGPVENTIKDILGGLRSTCTYVGAKTLKDLSKCTTFVRVNNQANFSHGSHV